MHRYLQVGESWEVSATPDFPSRVEGTPFTLAEVLASSPVAALGAEAALGRTSTALLVKLLDAADDLSVQIHPSDDYEGLAADEAGKPESWYVLEAGRGAGLYLGLAEGVTESSMRAALSSDSDVSKLLHFVPVAPGDFFVIEAGTAHAIGAGLTLLEPQHVAPGRRGVTYRYWDWNRRYDAAGKPDPNGAPRTLNVEDALAVTAFERPRGEALLAEVRLRSGVPDADTAAHIERFAGRGAPIESAHLDIRRIVGTGEVILDEDARPRTFRALTVTGGRVILRGAGFEIAVDAGRSAAIPASVVGLSAQCDGAHGLISAIA
jgi:mannose-6-phosphate isomerase